MKIEEKILNLSSKSLMTFGAAVSVEWQRWKPNFHSEEDNDLNSRMDFVLLALKVSTSCLPNFS